MAPRSQLWLRWLLPIAALTVLLSAHLAWRMKPDSTLVAQTRARLSATLSNAHQRATMAWRMHLQFPGGPPASAWVLHEGAQPGSGYEIHWLPDQLAVRVVRTDGVSVCILGTAILAHGPRLIDIARAGLRVQVSVDGQLALQIIDALPPPPARMWGFQAKADVGDVVLRLHDERDRLSKNDVAALSNDFATVVAVANDPQLVGQAVHAVARVRAALLADPLQTTTWDRLQRDARTAVASLGPMHPDMLGLDMWLTWNRMRGALAHAATDPQRFATTTALFLERVSAPQPAVEMPGLAVDLVALMSQRAAVKPQRALLPRDVLMDRRRLLHIVEQCGGALLDRDTLALDDGQRWWLRLNVQAAVSLRGGPGLPTPTAAPLWIAERWRAFNGITPTQGMFPVVQADWLERNPLQRGVESLIELAQFDPLAALSMTYAVEEAVRRQDPEAALAVVRQALATVPREAVLTQAILATMGTGSSVEARQALAQPDDDGVRLVHDDPLGFALDALLAQGLRRRGQGSELVLPGMVTVPEPLRWAEPVLNGSLQAPAEAWRMAPTRPYQAIAAALIIQEIVGASPDWALLEGLPHFTVPLHLIVPASVVETGSDLTNPGPKPAMVP